MTDNNRQDIANKKDPIRHVSDIRVTPTKPSPELPEEIGGREGPEPTRYGDWEVNGKCTDF